MKIHAIPGFVQILWCYAMLYKWKLTTSSWPVNVMKIIEKNWSDRFVWLISHKVSWLTCGKPTNIRTYQLTVQWILWQKTTLDVIRSGLCIELVFAQRYIGLDRIRSFRWADFLWRLVFVHRFHCICQLYIYIYLNNSLCKI